MYAAERHSGTGLVNIQAWDIDPQIMSQYKYMYVNNDTNKLKIWINQRSIHRNFMTISSNDKFTQFY